MEKVVARLPGAAFAVDQSLRVLAWNRKAEEGLGLPAAKALGRLCYEVVPAVDVETGLPCQETCPLAHGSPRHGWAHNRVLRAPWAAGRRTRLDCFLLRCLFPGPEQGNICFIGTPTASTVDAHSRVLEAVEAIYPVVSGPGDAGKALGVFVRTVLRAASADAGELFLLEPSTQELVLVEHQGLPTETVREFCRSVIGEGFPGLMISQKVPLLAVATAMGEAPARPSGWYLSAPLVRDGRIMGALGIASRRDDFDVASAARILFPVAVHASAYLRWAYSAGEEGQKAVGTALPSVAGRLRFYCLGSFRAVLDGEELPRARFHRLKALALLRFLVARRGRPTSREALMELLWPEADPARASGNLRVVLHALRRGLEGHTGRGRVILSEGDLIYLDPSSRVWVDAEDFVQRARRATELAGQTQDDEALDECRRAAELYKGEYLEDEPYSDWCLFERERLKETYLNLLKLMASTLAKRGDLAGAIDACRAALSADPGREEMHRELVGLLWQAGRRDEALRQYETCRRILQDELASEPTPETQSLYQALLAGTYEVG